MPRAQRVLTVETPVGPAVVTVSGAAARAARGLVVLGHGAGGGVDAPDLVAVTDALAVDGWRVARVVQPYRVAGRRAPAPAAQLDAAWTAVVRRLRRTVPGRPLVVGGRSSGARVACRTAGALGASAVVCLAFPLHPPGRPGVSRADELAVDLPVLVVQGERDAFGGPAELPAGPDVVSVPGDHALRRPAPVAAAVVAWLAQRVA